MTKPPREPIMLADNTSDGTARSVLQIALRAYILGRTDQMVPDFEGVSPTQRQRNAMRLIEIHDAADLMRQVYPADAHEVDLLLKEHSIPPKGK